MTTQQDLRPVPHLSIALEVGASQFHPDLHRRQSRVPAIVLGRFQCGITPRCSPDIGTRTSCLMAEDPKAPPSKLFGNFDIVGMNRTKHHHQERD